MKKIVIGLIIINILVIIGFNVSINKSSGYVDNSNIINNKYNQNNYLSFVTNTTNEVVENKNDLLNLLYTALNNGLNEFSFSCLNDCNDLIINALNDRYSLNVINNLVHPYNSFSDLKLTYNNGLYQIKIIKTYTESDIKSINKIVDIVLTRVINDNMTDKEKILAVHNYIINNTIYDNAINSNNAKGVFLDGKAICTGYSDALAIFLSKLSIDNFKVVSDKHVWNIVKLDNNWYHIDVTWDDLNDMIRYEYFLVNSNTLKTYHDDEHNYNKEIYNI